MPFDPVTGAEISASAAPDAAAAAAAATAAAAASGGKWFSALDADTQAYVTSRGLADKDPATAFADAAKAHREAQAFIGVPKEQLLRLPKADATPEEWDAVWRQFGKPETPDKYDLSTVKKGDGTDLDQVDVDFFRKTAADLNLPANAAPKLAAEVIKHLDAQGAAQRAEIAAAVTASQAALKTAWAQNFDANKLIAENAAKAFGVDLAGLDTRPGHEKVLELWRQIGTKIGEDTFIQNGQGGPGGNLHTAESAKAKITELKSDSEWTKRFLGGGLAERKESEELHTIAYGGGGAAR